MTQAIDRLPSVYQLPKKNIWACKIGYYLLEGGKRVRAFHYFGEGKVQAMADAIQIAAKWEANIVTYREWVEDNRGLLVREFPNAEWDKAIWVTGRFAKWVNAFEALKQTLSDKTRDVLNQYEREDAEKVIRRLQAKNPSTLAVLAASPAVADPVDAMILPGRYMTIEQVKDEFLAYKEGKIGGFKRKGGVEKISHSNLRSMLNAGLKPLDTTALITTLDHPALEKFVDGWYGRIGKKTKAKDGTTLDAISENTAHHYCFAVKQMLEWASRQPSIQYKLPETVDEFYNLPQPKTERKIQAYNADAIKTIIGKLKDKNDEKTVLAMLLALNTGAYQKDIANWGYERIDDDDPSKTPYSNLVIDGDDWYVWWKREKTKNKNGFFTLHWLMLEIRDMLKKHMKPNAKAKNPHMRLILNDQGQPLYTVTASGRTDNIGTNFNRAKKGTVNYPFGQLRKDVMNFIEETAKSTTMTQKMAGHSNDARRDEERAKEMRRQFVGGAKEGVLGNYLRDNFSDLTAVLKLWSERLKKDGIFEAAAKTVDAKESKNSKKFKKRTQGKLSQNR